MNMGEAVLRYLPGPLAERLNSNPFMRRIARGAFWTLIGAMAARVLRLPISVVLARLMKPASYGQLGIVVGSIDLFVVFAGFGLGLTATKHIAEYRAQDPVRAGRVLVVSNAVALASGVLFTVLLLVMAPWLARHTLAAPQLTVPLRIGALTLLFSAMNGAQLGALYGFEAFQITARLQAITGVADIPLMLGGYYFGGLNGVLFGMAISRFLTWLLMGFAVRAEARRYGIPMSWGDWKHEVRVLWEFSLPAALAGIMVVPVNWVCSAILVNQPRGYVDMGVYSAANQWYAALMFIPTMLGSALLPVLSERMGERDNDGSGKIVKTMLKLNSAIVLPIGIAMSIASPMIMRIYGTDYRQAWPTLVAVVWTAVIMGIINPIGDVIAASGRMWLGLLMNAGWAAVYIVSTALLVRWGSLGLASSRLLAYVVHAIWTFAFAYYVLQRRRNLPPGEPRVIVPADAVEVK